MKGYFGCPNDAFRGFWSLVLGMRRPARSLPAAGRAVAGRTEARLASRRRREPSPKTSPRLPEAPRVAEPVEARRIYRVTSGPWSSDFSVPEWLDLLDLTDRFRGFFGMLAILGVAVFLSDNRRAISRRVVFWGLALQWGFAILVLRVPAGVVVRPGRAERSSRPELRPGRRGVRLRRGAGRSPRGRRRSSSPFASCRPSSSSRPCSRSCITWA